MTCQNCPGTVWFDHKAKKWQHGSQPKPCDKPFPRGVSTQKS